MVQVGGVAGYQVNIGYYKDVNKSEGRHESGFQELVGDTGQESRGNREMIGEDSAGWDDEITRPEVTVLTYDYFGKVHNRKQNDGTNVNIVV